MALAAIYNTDAELKAYAQITDTNADADVKQTNLGVSRLVERYCKRQFNTAASADARVFYADTATWVRVPDFQSVTSLKTDTDGDASFSTTITSANYTLLPLNGVVDGQEGHPYNEIRLHDGKTFPMTDHRPGIELNALWGWAAVPDDVKSAHLIQGMRILRRKYHTPDGVAGFGDFVIRIPSKLDDDVILMLDPYRNLALVG